jgi:O-acetyl-ADP-ribose deacetylase
MIRALQGDITTLPVDVIVNAANTSLLGGGGVDGAIHRAAGPELLKECYSLNGCSTGDAKVTKGYQLPAQYVIHTVGPVWHGGKQGEAKALASCYRRSMELTQALNLKTMAFPCISTGVYRFPQFPAAAIAVQTVQHFMAQPSSIEEVVFCCFLIEDLRIYEQLLSTSAA